MLALAASSLPLTLGAIAGLVGAVVAAAVALRKMGPEKDSIFISSAQGAAVIMDNLVETLREEVDRCRAKVALQESEIAALAADNERLRAANKTLAQQKGRRHVDREE